MKNELYSKQSERIAYYVDQGLQLTLTTSIASDGTITISASCSDADGINIKVMNGSTVVWSDISNPSIASIQQVQGENTVVTSVYGTETSQLPQQNISVASISEPVSNSKDTVKKDSKTTTKIENQIKSKSEVTKASIPLQQKTTVTGAVYGAVSATSQTTQALNTVSGSVYTAGTMQAMVGEISIMTAASKTVTTPQLAAGTYTIVATSYKAMHDGTHTSEARSTVTVEGMGNGTDGTYSFDTLMNYVDTLEGYAKDYVVGKSGLDPNKLVMQFIRQSNYNDGMWPYVAGSVHSDFKSYVIGKAPYLGNVFGTTIPVILKDPKTRKKIDFSHLIATMNGIVYNTVYPGSGYEFIDENAQNAEDIINVLCG